MGNSKKGFMKRRIPILIAGVIVIGICVGCYRLSSLGVDACTCMNLGISGFLGMSFGNWQVIMNAVILVFMFFLVRSCIGIGTLINMVSVGYSADFLCWLVLDMLHIEMTLPLRILALALGSLFAGIGVALFLTADLGLSPYDSIAVMIENGTKGRICFRNARMVSDFLAIIIGVGFCLAAGGKLGEVIGVGTICNACFNGPLIQYFRTHFTEPLLEKGQEK